MSSRENFVKALRILRTVLPLTVGLGLLILVIAWLAGTFVDKIAPQRLGTQDRMLADQSTEIVHEVEQVYVEEALGTLKAESRTVVSAKVLATINEITVTAGSQVEAGDVLIRLQNDDLQARLRQNEQALTAATANRVNAESDQKRNEKLFEENAVSRALLDDASRRAQVALAEESRAQQAVEEAKVMLAYTTIVATKSGRVVDRLAEPGDTASPGVPLLVLYDATSMRLEAPVSEKMAVTLRVGDSLKVYMDALTREFDTTVDEIVPQADALSRTFLVKTSLPNSDDLYEGMFGRLRIPAGKRRHLCLATSAVQEMGQLEFVDVVLEGGMLERRFIKTGRLGMPGRVEVLSGLRAGERVVLHDTPVDKDTME